MTTTILVTNYKTGLRSEPIKNVMPDALLSFDESQMELTINGALFVGVFERVPHMRNISVNKDWFEGNIYHLR